MRVRVIAGKDDVIFDPDNVKCAVLTHSEASSYLCDPERPPPYLFPVSAHTFIDQAQAQNHKQTHTQMQTQAMHFETMKERELFLVFSVCTHTLKTPN